MFSNFFINRPKFAFIIAIVTVFVGLIAIKKLPLSQYPDILPPIVQVSTSYPGADAMNLEKTVVEPLEQQINGIENMIYMFTQCSDQGNVVINVSFNVGTKPDIDAVNTLIRTNIAQPQLPPEVVKEGISVMQVNTDVLSYLTLYSPSGKYDAIYLSNYLYLRLQDPISRIPGVGQVIIFDGFSYAIRVWVDPVKMASLRVTPNEVLEAINEQNLYVPAGQLGGPPSIAEQQFAYTLLLQERFTKVEEFKNIIIRAGKDGSLVKLGDVSDISLGGESYQNYALLNGKPASVLAVYLLPGANAIQVADEIKRIFKEAKKSFPEGLEGEVVYDTTNYVKVSMFEVIKTLIIAIILVVFVVYLFLQDLKTMIIPSVAIPVSLIGTFAVMLAMGYSINMISLMGMILAIGIVVDDAIVVVENVHRIMDEESLNSRDATIKAMKQVTGPVIATTLVLMAVFVPIAFIPGISGQMYRQFGITIATSVAISAINALTLSPALCATILKKVEQKKVNIFFKTFNKVFEKLTSVYMKAVITLTGKLPLVIICLIVIMAAIIFIYSKTPTGFLPDEDQGLLNVDIQMPSSASLVRTAEVLAKVEKIVQKQPGVSNIISTPGRSVLNFANASNLGHMMVNLEDWSKRKLPELSQNSIKQKLIKILKDEIPEARVIVFDRPPIPGLGQAGGFQFELQQELGNNPQALSEVLHDFIEEAKKQPELTGIYSNYVANIPKLKINTNIAKVKKLGINLQDVYNAVNAYIGSIYINEFNIFGKVFQVLIQAKSEQRSTEDDLKNIYLQSADNKLIPLSTVITLESVLQPNIVNHYNMLASAEIEGTAAPGYSSGQAIAAMERVAKRILPEGFTYGWTGTAYQEIIAGNTAIWIFLVVIAFIYFFLVAKYESWMVSIAVMLSIPVAVIGSLVAVRIAQIENNIYVQVGLVLIFSMAAKTAILIVEFAHENHKKGENILNASYYAAKIRFRAVIMTALAFILGVFPLVVATGAGAMSRRALGTAVFGGMLASAVIGTIFVPCSYVVVQKIVERGKNKSTES